MMKITRKRLALLPGRLHWPPVRLSKLLLLMPILGFLTACGDLHLDAPRGSNISLMPKEKPATVQVEQVVWFKYWGNEPFSVPETHAATIIEDRHLAEARIRMVNTFADVFISAFTGPFGFPRRTLIVEGNPPALEENVAITPTSESDKP